MVDAFTPHLDCAFAVNHKAGRTGLGVVYNVHWVAFSPKIRDEYEVRILLGVLLFPQIPKISLSVRRAHVLNLSYD